MTRERVLEFLDQNELHYERVDHPPVFTCEQAQELVPPLTGQRTKNLFLRDRSGKRHFLVVVPPEKSVDLKRLASVIPSSKLSLGSPERLQKHLGVEPGSVTLLGLLNDAENRVEVILDECVDRAEKVRCHPLVNTSTLALERGSLTRFLELTGHPAQVIDVPVRD